MLSIAISILTLLALLYELYLQREHNEKSLKPFGQIYFVDRNTHFSIQILNNGLGPLIIDRLTFKKDDTTYYNIEGCLDLDPKSYMRISGDDSVKRVILADSFLTVFETTFDEADSEVNIHHVRMQLTPIKLTVEGRDIYDNTFTITRNFNWFSRHDLRKPVHPEVDRSE